jgi:hypothetical protein
VSDPENREPADSESRKSRPHISIIRVIIRCIADTSLTPLVDYIESEWSAVRSVWKDARAICILLALLALALGWLINGYITAAKIGTLTGALNEKSDATEKLERRIETIQQTNLNNITRLTQDFNEEKRGKDTEITRTARQCCSSSARSSPTQATY